MWVKKLFFPEKDAWFCSEYSPEQLLEVMQKNTRSGNNEHLDLNFALDEQDYLGEIYSGGFCVSTRSGSSKVTRINLRGIVQQMGSGSHLRVNLSWHRVISSINIGFCVLMVLLEILFLVNGIVNRSIEPVHFGPLAVAVIEVLTMRAAFGFSCRAALNDLAFVLKLEPIQQKEK